jgi:hypothetical protein
MWSLLQAAYRWRCHYLLKRTFPLAPYASFAREHTVSGRYGCQRVCRMGDMVDCRLFFMVLGQVYKHVYSVYLPNTFPVMAHTNWQRER